MYRRLSILPVVHSRTIDDVCKIALAIAKKRNYGIDEAARPKDSDEYRNGTRPFDGTLTNVSALDWWKNMLISANDSPLNCRAINLSCLTPHAVDFQRTPILFPRFNSQSTALKTRSQYNGEPRACTCIPQYCIREREASCEERTLHKCTRTKCVHCIRGNDSATQQLEGEVNATQTVLTSNGDEYIEGEMCTIAELETALDKVAAALADLLN